MGKDNSDEYHCTRIITSLISIENSGIKDSLSFSESKPYLIDTFKKIFVVSPIDISLEFSKVTKNGKPNVEFFVHVKSSDYEETEKIKNITNASNFTALIKNVANEDNRLKHVEVKTAAFSSTRFYLADTKETIEVQLLVDNLIKWKDEPHILKDLFREFISAITSDLLGEQGKVEELNIDVDYSKDDNQMDVQLFVTENQFQKLNDNVYSNKLSMLRDKLNKMIADRLPNHVFKGLWVTDATITSTKPYPGSATTPMTPDSVTELNTPAPTAKPGLDTTLKIPDFSTEKNNLTPTDNPDTDPGVKCCKEYGVKPKCWASCYQNDNSLNQTDLDSREFEIICKVYASVITNCKKVTLKTCCDKHDVPEECRSLMCEDKCENKPWEIIETLTGNKKCDKYVDDVSKCCGNN